MMMADVDIGLKIPATFPLVIWYKPLVVMGEVGIGTIPDTLPPITKVTMVYCCVYLVLITMLMVVFMKMKEVIVGVIVQDVKVGLNISATLPFKMLDKCFILMEEVDLGIRTAFLPPIIQA